MDNQEKPQPRKILSPIPYTDYGSVNNGRHADMITHAEMERNFFNDNLALFQGVEDGNALAMIDLAKVYMKSFYFNNDEKIKNLLNKASEAGLGDESLKALEYWKLEIPRLKAEAEKKSLEYHQKSQQEGLEIQLANYDAYLNGTYTGGPLPPWYDR